MAWMPETLFYTQGDTYGSGEYFASFVAYDGQDIIVQKRSLTGGDTFFERYDYVNNECLVDECYFSNREIEVPYKQRVNLSGYGDVNCFWMFTNEAENKIYAVGTSTITKINYDSLLPEASWTMPTSVFNRPAYGDGKIWFVEYVPDMTAVQQRLYWFDVASETFDSVVLQGRVDYEISDLAVAFDGTDHVYVTRCNEHSVHKHSSTDGSFVSSILVARHPRDVTYTGSKIYVVAQADATSMLYTRALMQIEPSTDAVTAFAALRDNGGQGVHQTILDDGFGYLWVGDRLSDGTNIRRCLGRLKKSNKDYKHSIGGLSTSALPTVGARIVLDDTNTEYTISSVPSRHETLRLVTPQNGGVEPYVFLHAEPWQYTVSPVSSGAGTGRICWFRATDLVRKNSYSVKGTTMIAVDGYYGGTQG